MTLLMGVLFGGQLEVLAKGHKLVKIHALGLFMNIIKGAMFHFTEIFIGGKNYRYPAVGYLFAVKYMTHDLLRPGLGYRNIE